ncbi:MAG: DUF2270 domain-containing protein [Planctomycetota bacterium]|nr:DUF2270 domain-containing protein [Planctomycetota bacterium]MDP6763377.1 DUF2270 domain-containing protein [Planctomycetota bacterium]MDP6988645.1 DUF2270 domain-containing protein [Planctomycetota bacterium]
MSATDLERDPSSGVDYESTPLTRQEYVSAVVHLYRGELYRANAWRLRLDNTTNWAVLTTAGLLTFSFDEGRHSHWILLGGFAVVSVFLLFEARRFRYADVWRARVRMIEENFYGPILRRDPVSPEEQWGPLVAEDLFRPRFKLSTLAALRSRFVRNYWAIYSVVSVAWGVKVITQPVSAESWEGVRENLSGAGLLPWWLPLALVGGIWACALALMVCVPRATSYDLEEWRFEAGRDAGSTGFDL